MGLFSFLDKLMDKLPIQGRIERMKNQLENLERERNELLQKTCGEKESKRMSYLIVRIAYLNQLLRNKTTD
jgi:hypothetical protein